MASDVAAIITALGGLISITLGALAYFLRQKSQAGRPAELLRRLRDFLADQDFWHATKHTTIRPVPDSLRRDVDTFLDSATDDGTQGKP